jgi:hypothetical protein
MTKLTLYLDDKLVKTTKKFAKRSGTSLSKLTANYYKAITKGYKKPDEEIPQVVREMIGILKDDGKSYKQIREEYYEHIANKHK